MLHSSYIVLIPAGNGPTIQLQYSLIGTFFYGDGGDDVDEKLMIRNNLT